MNEELIEEKRSPITLYVLLAIFGFVSCQLVLKEPERRAKTKVTIDRFSYNICQAGYRIPGIDCSHYRSGTLQQANAENREKLNDLIHRQPDLASALKQLSWFGGTEVEAVRMTTLLRAIVYSRYNESYRTNPQQDALLDKIWLDFPYVAYASACYYCVRHSAYLVNAVKILESPFAELERSVKYYPGLFGIAVEKNWLHESDTRKVARLVGFLQKAGDTGAARNVGNVLIDTQQFDSLLAWVSDGLNGGRAIPPSRFSQVPREILVSAWERGASMAYVTNELTEFMVKQGYRPAMRYVVWYRSGVSPYLKSQNSFKGVGYILDQFMEFPEPSGPGLARFYSKNWERIYFDDVAGKWLVD